MFILWKTYNGSELKKFAQRGARTHDPEIKSLMLYRLS